MGSVLKQHLRAKYGAAGKECVDTDVADLRKLQTWLYDLEIRSSQPCTLRVRTRGVSVTTLGDFTVERDIKDQPCSPRWSLPRGMFTRAPLRFGCVARVRSVHGLSALPLTSCAFGRDSRLRIHS